MLIHFSSRPFLFKGGKIKSPIFKFQKQKIKDRPTEIFVFNSKNFYRIVGMYYLKKEGNNICFPLNIFDMVLFNKNPYILMFFIDCLVYEIVIIILRPCNKCINIKKIILARF